MLDILELYTSGFWVWAGISFGAGSVMNFLFRVYNRTLRSLNISRHGYPTAPLMDADGDIVHPPKEGE